MAGRVGQVACVVRHQARVRRDANQGLIDVVNHVAEAQLVVAVHGTGKIQFSEDSHGKVVELSRGW